MSSAVQAVKKQCLNAFVELQCWSRANIKQASDQEVKKYRDQYKATNVQLGDSRAKKEATKVCCDRNNETK